jgi:SOS-response transcriptional repressor LexA
MTPRQEQIYRYILWYKKENGYVPSAYYIAKAHRVSVQSIQQVFDALKELGLIEPKPHEPRGDYKVIHRSLTRK